MRNEAPLARRMGNGSKTNERKAPEPKTYRFGLYGRSGSGKTCFLAALAMRRRPHPQNFTATRLPVKNGAAANEALACADKWLDEAIRHLEKGELPRPTPPEDPEQNARQVRFEFTAPERGRFRVTLSDYSGELVDAREQGEDSLADRLRRHMENLDGLLVIVEAPRADSDDAQAADDVRMLREAFAPLRGGDGAALRIGAPNHSLQAVHFAIDVLVGCRWQPAQRFLRTGSNGRDTAFRLGRQ